jgi:polyisoprenoid-binding protein YceI
MKTNMKKGIFGAVIVLALVAFTAPVEMKKINVEKSSINWVGEKITGSHTGTINFSEGYVEMTDGKLSGGKFVVDMTTINVTDLEAGNGKEKLEGHLNSDDFFGVKNHPTATFTIKTAAEKSPGVYGVSGDLTIKGKTNPIAFDLKMNGSMASTKLVIDRTKYDIRYGSGSFFDNLGDKTIYDEFTLDIKIQM